MFLKALSPDITALDSYFTRHRCFFQCPASDRDNDAVPDSTDACPDRPGAPSSNPRLNGCPGLVLVTGGVIRINRPVFFANNSDQILPRISSNVSVFPTEPEADPLADWLNSCRKLKAAIPEGALILPSHNEPFYGAHKRLDALVEGHETALKRLLSRLDEPKRAIELFTALFARAIEKDVLGMATGETIAHLNCLKGRGLVTSVQDGGTTLYRRAS